MKVDSILLLVILLLTVPVGRVDAANPQSVDVLAAGQEAERLLNVAGRLQPHNPYAAAATGRAGRTASASATLGGFDLLTREMDALLRWTTTAEHNNAGFEVQYRLLGVPGTEYLPVGFVDGVGDSDQQNLYRFGVRNLVAGEHEFRLKITSRAGSTTYSDPVRVAVGTRPAFALGQGAHDPDTGVVYVPYTLADPGIVRLIVEDAKGNLAATIAFGTHEAGTHVAYFNSAVVTGPGFSIRLHTEHGSVSRSLCLDCAN